MPGRSGVVFTGVVLLTALLAGCAGTPAPEPSTSASLSDEEAFAVAEETYRAYVDALNEVDLADPATFEPVYALTTGELNAQDRESFSTWYAEGFTLTGEAGIRQVSLGSLDRSGNDLIVDLNVCYDVTAVDVLRPDGSSVVDPGRPDIQPLQISEKVDSSGALISHISPAEGFTC